jgi:hypothetical protein
MRGGRGYKPARPGTEVPGFFMGEKRFMRKIALLGFSALLAVGFAGAAAADTMDSTFGNTVIVTNGKGEKTKLWFKADGSYTGEAANGQKFSGKWAIKDGKYCGTPDAPMQASSSGTPAPAPVEACGEYVTGKNVGDTWTQKDSQDQPITVTIQSGM